MSTAELKTRNKRPGDAQQAARCHDGVEVCHKELPHEIYGDQKQFAIQKGIEVPDAQT